MSMTMITPCKRIGTILPTALFLVLTLLMAVASTQAADIPGIGPPADLPSSPVAGTDDTPSCGAGGDSCAAKSDVGSSPSDEAQPGNSVGNPINLMTGNKYQSEVDFQISGAMLSLKRMYNSGNSDSNLGLGQGWYHSYSVSLFDSGNGRRQIVQSNGARLTFVDQGTDENGYPLYRSTWSNQGYLTFENKRHYWHLSDGRVLKFNGTFLVEIDWPDQRKLKLFYRSQRLHTVTDETGRVLRFTYSGNSQAEALPAYDKVRFGSAPGYLDSVTLPDGSIIGYDYDDRRNLTRVRFPNGSSREYHYEDESYPNHLTGLTDRTGVHFASWSYDDEGRAISSEHAGGVEKVTLDYPDLKAVESGDVVQTVATNSLGGQSVYTWQKPVGATQGQLLSSTGARCATCPSTGMEYIYDEQGRILISTKTGQGNATGLGGVSYTYDEQGRISEIRRVDAAGQDHLVERREYEDTGLHPLRTYKPSVNPDGERLSEIQRDAKGRPVTIIERGYSPWVALPGESGYVDNNSSPSKYRAIERITELTYNDNGQLVSSDGPRSDVEDITHYRWDAKARLVSIEPPASPAMHFRDFDAMGRVVESQMGNSSSYHITYDDYGQLSRIEHLGIYMMLTYDAEGRLIETTDADGRTRQQTFDDAGRLTARRDALGRQTQILLNSESQVNKQSLYSIDDQLMQAVTLVYDEQARVSSRLEQRIDQTGTPHQWTKQLERETNGDISAIVDVDSGFRIGINLNAVGTLGEYLASTDDLTRYHFDVLGQEQGLEDARGTSTWRYRDDDGQIVGVISDDTGVERYERNSDGQVIRQVREDSGVTVFVRDAAGRAIERTSAQGPITRWAHDPETGRLIRAENGEVVEHFKHDLDGQLIVHTREMDKLSFTTRYWRDERGRIERKQLPDEQQLRYRYHEDGVEAGTLASISRVGPLDLLEKPIVSEIDLEAGDGNSGWVAHNGLRTQLSHTATGSVERLSSETLLNIENQWSLNGQLHSQSEAGNTARYAYDQGRLTAANTVAGQYRYDYDAVGNRTQRIEAHSDGSMINERYEYASHADGGGAGNRMVKRTNQENGTFELLSYSPGGMPLNSGKHQYEYDAQRRPISVSINGETIARYFYNAFGERVKKELIGPDGTTQVRYFLFDGPRLSAEVDAKGEIDAQYVYIDQTRAVAKLHGKTIYAIHSDHRGAPVRMTNSDQTVVWSARYEPFGEAVVLLDSVSLALRLPGQYYDAETSTHYNYYRDYDPATGRYLSSDPIGLSGGVNTYLYAFADPLRLIDPLGLRVILMDRALTGLPDSLSYAGRHQFLVIIPDKPEDFLNRQFRIQSGVDFELMDVGNGEMGFVIGAQNYITAGGNRLIAQAFNGADRLAAQQHFSGLVGTNDQDYNANTSQCTLTTSDTAAVETLLASISNYNYNEERLNIPYPTISQTISAPYWGYVNSNSWAQSALGAAAIDPDITNFPGLDLLNGNRIDPDYFTSNPNINDLTAENTNTDGDEYIDAIDDDDDGDGVPDIQDAFPRDPSQA